MVRDALVSWCSEDAKHSASESEDDDSESDGEIMARVRLKPRPATALSTLRSAGSGAGRARAKSDAISSTGREVADGAGGAEEETKKDLLAARQRHSIGLAYQSLRQHDKALRNFQAALKEDPTHVPSRYHSALMLHQLGEYGRAIAQLDLVMDAAGDERRVREARGLAFQALGRHDAAVKVRSDCRRLVCSVHELFTNRVLVAGLHKGHQMRRHAGRAVLLSRSQPAGPWAAQ